MLWPFLYLCVVWLSVILIHRLVVVYPSLFFCPRMYIVTSLNQLIAPESDANGGASQVCELMTVGALELDGVLWFVPIVT